MKAARVIGCVVASQKPSSLDGIKLLLLQPTDWNGNPEGGDYIIAADTVSSGIGELIFYVEARDASIALHSQPPIDAAIIGIIDGVSFEGSNVCR
jgi:ethanolamine utilization protein EutN